MVIESLDLSGNLLSSLDSSMQLPRLRKLDLAGNKITAVAEDALRGMSELESVDLSKNLITVVSTFD
jgi:Leucine-rich repeat (LRR) protein